MLPETLALRVLLFQWSLVYHGPLWDGTVVLLSEPTQSLKIESSLLFTDDVSFHCLPIPSWTRAHVLRCFSAV